MGISQTPRDRCRTKLPVSFHHKIILVKNLRKFLGTLEFIFVRRLAWTVESLPSNPAAPVRFPAGSGILIFYPVTGLCPLPMFRPLLSLAVARKFCRPQIFGGPALLYFSSVLVQNLYSPTGM